MHFLMFSDSWICQHRSSISLSDLQRSFSVEYLVQSLKYTAIVL